MGGEITDNPARRRGSSQEEGDRHQPWAGGCASDILGDARYVRVLDACVGCLLVFKRIDRKRGVVGVSKVVRQF